MELRNFQIDVPGKGVIDVNFTLHFNDNSVSVNEIKLHSDFDSGLPHHPQLRLHDNVWQLYAQVPVMKNNEMVIVDEFLNDDLSKQIVEKILQIRNESKVW